MSKVPPCKRANRPEIEQIMADIFNTHDMSRLDLFRKLMAVSNLLNHLASEYREDVRLSHARMRLLMRLAVSDRMGDNRGLPPSELSRFLGVSRNTVSSLLNGLEEQGLIEGTIWFARAPRSSALSSPACLRRCLPKNVPHCWRCWISSTKACWTALRPWGCSCPTPRLEYPLSLRNM
jgi:hypothetical protein